jgi:integrase/transcriptional regulator with XRE-family HTH domain
MAYHINELRKKGASEGTIRNAELALERFMKAARRSITSGLGNEWQDDGEFSALVARCGNGRPDSSKRSLKSLLRAWRESALCIIDERKDVGDGDFYDIFRDALKAFQSKHNLSLQEVARRLSMNRATLSRFLNIDSTITDRAIHIPLDEVERVLELPKGVLIRARAKQRLPAKSRTQIPHRTALPALQADRYRLPTPPPMLPVHKEFLELRDFKTADILPYRMQRSERWVIRSLRDAPRKSPKWPGTLEDGRYCPTADATWYPIANFLGWVTRPVNQGGKGIPPETISLAYITDVELLRDFLEFHRKRYNGEVSSSFLSILHSASSLLRPGTGYIRQIPAFALRLRNPVPENQWDNWCDQSREVVGEMIAALKLIVHKRRDPRDPIDSILARQHPLTAIAEMLANMQKHLPRAAYHRALLARNHLLIKFLSVVPLRVRNIAALTYREANQGHLKKIGVEWILTISGREFKNYRHAARTDFSVTLPKELGDELSEYIEKWRPILRAKSPKPDDDALFLQQNGEKFPSVHLSQLVSALTEKYCPDTPGFGPHAFRHIVATEYLKNNPNGYQVVAYILHDKLETVLREYGHVTTSDGFAHWAKYLEDSALTSERKDTNPEK